MWVTVARLGPLAVALGFISPACTGCLGIYSLWMDIFLSLDIVERAVGLPQSDVPHPLWSIDRGGVGEYVEEKGGRKGVRLGMVCVMKEIVCFLFWKIKKKTIDVFLGSSRHHSWECNCHLNPCAPVNMEGISTHNEDMGSGEDLDTL